MRHEIDRTTEATIASAALARAHSLHLLRDNSTASEFHVYRDPKTRAVVIEAWFPDVLPIKGCGN